MDIEITEFRLQNVGTADIVPSYNIVAVVDGTPVVLEPIEGSMGPYETKRQLDTCIHDDRHELTITEREGVYEVRCSGHCRLSLDLQEAESPYTNFHPTDF